MTNLRRYTREEIVALTESIGERLAGRALTDAGVDLLLQDFKFRDKAGETWTLGPLSRVWFKHHNGAWAEAEAPSQEALDGPVDLGALGTQGLKRRPETGETAADKPAADDPRAYVERAVDRVARAYDEGAIHSDGAEGLLEGIYAVDASGTVWSVGVRSHEWYAFEGQGWSRAGRVPDLESVEAQPSTAPPKFCGNCGHALPTGVKFCPNCGTPVPNAGSGSEEGAAEKVRRFLTSAGDLFPEPVVPPWAPPTDFPERVQTCPHCAALNVGDMSACVSCKRPLKAGQGAQPAQTVIGTRKPPAPAAPVAAAAVPVQADASAPAPERPRSSRRAWIIGAGIGCLVLFCACAAVAVGYWVLLPDSNEAAPVEVLQPDSLPEEDFPSDIVPVVPVNPGGDSGLLLDDTFDDPANTAVPLFGSDFLEFELEDGLGRFTAKFPGVLVAAYEDLVIADFEATATMDIRNPPIGAGYGMIFRGDDPAGGMSHYYMAWVKPVDGLVTLERFDSDGFTVLADEPLPDVPFQSLDLTVFAEGSTLYVDINGEPVMTVEDSGILEPGILGLAVNSPKNGDSVYFDAFEVWALEP